ncbi:hypothetical protein C8A03DRAFT_16180 [Achaetomium macrosporum]|uniref:P-loop containing nucleoside triphosphate hydrolase protein n=1 Tax=Achaetomium macrosporum TaxID=79813 RepID=A0AAN7C985_9PEZI|nr:hypothetical protein C8A03DRAFT_16180 [Achaetomium macrosporum]
MPRFTDFSRWHASLHPIQVDIVGDFAGRGLFAIHGEALLTYCLECARVDFKCDVLLTILLLPDGFQLLHAVHAVENFLAKLRDRGCIFNVLWFEKEADICIPTDVLADTALAAKYRLARGVLIQHLSRPISSRETKTAEFSYAFPSLQSGLFREYLDSHPLHFFLGSNAHHDGAADAQDKTTPLHMMYLMASAGYCMAFIEDIAYRSSKVFLSMTTPRGNITPLLLREDQPAVPIVASRAMRETMKRLAEITSFEKLTTREFVSTCALSVVFSSKTQETDEVGILRSHEAAAVLLHLVTLRHYDLSQRSFAEEQGNSPNMTSNTPFLAAFFEAARDGLVAWSEGSFAELEWDAFDFFDGRLYINVAARLSFSLPQEIFQELAKMAKLLNVLSGVDISAVLPVMSQGTTAGPASQNRSPAQDQAPDAVPCVLPFSHPVVDQYLVDVRLDQNGVAPVSSTSGKIFEELTHWHNVRAPVDPKHIPKPLSFFAQRRHQKFMSDTIAYSASLTGASGKNIDPETIVVCSTSAKGGKPMKDGRPMITKEKEMGVKTKKGAPKSNKQKALEQAEALRLKKLAILSQSVAATWRERCSDFEKQSSMVKRYLRAEKYLLAMASPHKQIVGAEVLLYLSHVLLRMQNSPETPKSTVPALLAMLWSKVTEISKLPLTEQVHSQLAAIENSLNIAIERATTPPFATTRPLAFKPLAMKGVKLLPAGTTPREFLLEHCGPYLERSFDSAPDARVPSFNPDAWQRKVLDAIDANKSVLAVAPTSAGKTFISFYAMKKVLQANDDDVLVYVAPTKALVNQIAAEIQARFSKKYTREGKFVWAIHTRDYRVNNVKGCQILVTVPQMLQILLLAPVNARGPHDFSRRIKRIIFDEVHCIGQSDDGVIWEQLLLLAPCPIIALSATIGNPDDFKDWLERSQNVKGFELEMIVHSSRYSDLRKFIHDPVPSTSEFTGLAPVERLPFPGLDSELGRNDATPFLFVHPIGSVVDKNRETLNDTSLEPKDCLSLWRCMKKHETPEYVVPPSVDPENALPAVVRKADVVRWEAALKGFLAEWMADPRSPFDAVREGLRRQRYARLASEFDTACSDDDVVSTDTGTHDKGPMVSSRSAFSLVTDLRTRGALPAILFNYDRANCEAIVADIFRILTLAETKHRETDRAWISKVAEFEKWKRGQDSKKKFDTNGSGRRGAKGEEGMGKAELEREAASREFSKWESFDPDAPLPQFSFADTTKMSREEVEERLRTIYPDAVRPPFIEALRRGVGVHHAGMNRQYRQVVEMLFRKGYLTVVVATGTLAMGINMPCKTVVFTGDSVFLTALNYRQASGRAGRRGFDVLGNVVFHNLAPHRVLEVMSAKLPDLRGQFPTSVTLILRLFTLLHGTDNSNFAAGAVKALLTQNRLYLGGPAAKMSIAHHLRFSIEYFRRQHLLSATGAPLNFSGLIGHLYYTESAAFAFHALLQEGYFHEVCASFSASMSSAAWRNMAQELVLTLSHLFLRFPCVKTNTSLPALPRRAYEILSHHNAQTLAIFRDYVRSYTTQHLAHSPDNALPLTGHTISPITNPDRADANPLSLPYLTPVTIRSPFHALSGCTDSSFATVQELCETVRAGVPLEASVVPGVPLSSESDKTKLNSYLLDFFKHGDATALTRDNRIKGGEVWFRLKDFSLVLATVVTSLAGFMGMREGDDNDMLDGSEDGGYFEEEVGERGDGDGETRGGDKDGEKNGKADMKAAKKKKGKKKVVAESWEDEELSSSMSESETEESSVDAMSGLGRSDSTPTESVPSWARDANGQSLSKVYGAFEMVQRQFDEKFKQMWA